MFRDFSFFFPNSGSFIAIEDVRFSGLSETGGHKLGFNHILDLFNSGDTIRIKFMSGGVNHLVGNSFGINFRIAFLRGEHSFSDGLSNAILFERHNATVSFPDFFEVIPPRGHFFVLEFIFLPAKLFILISFILKIGNTCAIRFLFRKIY